MKKTIKWILEICNQEGYRIEEFMREYNLHYRGF
jgi:hypothetical protein